MNTNTNLTDDRTTLNQLKSLVQQFTDERNWQQFHSPKNLSMALAIEAAELMEHFQWLSMQESRTVATEPERKAAVSDELADVFCYTLAIANEMQIDLADVFEQKMIKNRKKYPTNQIKGRYGHDDPNPVQA